MKWYNKDKTQMVDLDKVEAFFYVFARPEDFGRRSHLKLFVHGAQVEFWGINADEIYNILKNQKDVLHS